MQFSYSAVAAVFASLLGVIVLCFFLKEHRRKHHRFLILFLLVLIYVQLYAFVFHSGHMLSMPWLLNTNIPLIFLLGPLLYGYGCHLKKCELVPLQWILHLIPFIFVAIYYVNFYVQQDAYKLNVIATAIEAEVPVKAFIKTFPVDPWNINGWIVVEFQCVHMLIYGLASHFSLRKSEAQSNWLILLNFSLIAASIVLFMTEGGVINGERFLMTLLPQLSNEFFAVLVLYSAAIYLIIRPTTLVKYVPKYQKSILDSDWKKRKAEDLLKTLGDNKLYLQPNLSLQLLADIMGIKKHHLSQVINQELGCTFFELVNSFRIKEARFVLKKGDDCKMESLAYQLGYRSKSAFFNAFKKETNQTPGQFARSN